MQTPQNASCVAVIVAAGQGLRMQNAIPKQFLPLNGKPILYHTVKSFVDAVPGIKIVLVLHPDYFSYANMILQHFPNGIDLTLVAGGENRFESVRNGLAETREEDIIFVHDGVRPLISKKLIMACYFTAKEHGSAIPTVPIVDSIRKIGNKNSSTVDRETLRAVQTPQTFIGSILIPAFEQEYQVGFTDEATVVEHYGETIFLIEGEKQNLKITTPEDLIYAAFIQNAADE